MKMISFKTSRLKTRLTRDTHLKASRTRRCVSFTRLSDTVACVIVFFIVVVISTTTLCDTTQATSITRAAHTQHNEWPAATSPSMFSHHAPNLLRSHSNKASSANWFDEHSHTPAGARWRRVTDNDEDDCERLVAPKQRRTRRQSRGAKNHVLSQEHVVLDKRFTAWATDTATRTHRAPALLFVQQSRASSNNEGDNAAETFYIRKGANGTLPCLPVLPADSQATQNKIEWFKEEKKLMEAESKRIVVWNTKNSIAYLPETGALLFRGVSNDDSGEYHCVLTKVGGGGESEDGIVRFYVQDVPDPPQMPIVTGFTQRSVNLSWVPSYDFHYSPILHYIIHVREGVDGAWDLANGIMTPDNRTQYEIIGLKPFTTYAFRVLAVNSIGVGEPSPQSHYIITLRQKPDSRLTILSAHNVSNSAIRLEWLPPSTKEIHGEFVGFRIRYVHQLPESAPAPRASNRTGPSAVQPPVRQPTLDGPMAREIIVGDTKETSYVIKGLQTYTLYRISVQVSNPAGDGPSTEVLAMTDEGVASAPLDLSVVKAGDSFVQLRWQEPRSPNGILQGYKIVLYDVANNSNDTRKLSDPRTIMEHTIGELKPFTWYLVHVFAYSRKFDGDPSVSVKFRTDVSAPSPPQLINVTCYSHDSILIQWQKPEDYYNQIDYYYVRYKPYESVWDSYTSGSGGASNAGDATNGLTNKEEETTLSASKKDKQLNELLITNLTADELYELKVLAGTRSIHEPTLIYRSEPSQTFRVVLRANCESYTAYPITESTFNTSLGIGVACASFALALVTASLVVWRRHCQAAYYYLDEPHDASRGTNSPQLSETYDDTEYGSVPVNDWLRHVQKLHADSDCGFSREFEQIQAASQQKALLTCEHSQLPENKHKNRYINIVAYDHTRVTLRAPLSGQKKIGCDYINANFIDGYNKPRAYIGTQGPLVSTFDDYWRMIWEQRVVIIVMITNLQERGRRKCDMYWPKEGSETYGYVQVKLLQQVVMATYTLRTFTIRNTKLKKRSAGSERTVYQYHYTNWPDHGVPDHPLPVLSFVRKSAAANPPGAGAIICHCSAGCGRSGTYIVIDAMLKQIRHKQSINVVDFLKHIRTQRNYLVQTEEQYVFIHDSLVEAIESGETEIPSNFIAKYIQLLQTGGGSGGVANKQAAGSNYSLVSGYNIASCQSPTSANGATALLSVATSDATAAPNGAEQPLISTSNSGGNLLIANGTSSTRCQSSASGAQWSLLERQYRLVASFKAKDFCVVSALKPCNKNKNRTLNLIPLEAHRVHITPKPGQDGSDYINATFLMGFNHLREFIVTQHPVHETFSDFWQMVYDHNSQTIVLLTQMMMSSSQQQVNNQNTDTSQSTADLFDQFWPQKEDEVDYGSFKVKLIQETTLAKADCGGLIITRDFIMRSNQDDYELQTRIIHCPGWPECCGPLSSVFDLIQVVQQATQQQAHAQRLHDAGGRQQNSGTVTIGQEHEPQNGGPIIVVDKFGGTEAATFAVLTTLYKQINFEDAVDVYMYAKLAHLRRPGIWSSQDDYLFLYRAMENYATNLLAQQLQQQQQAQQQEQASSDMRATAASLTAPISMANLRHHQTMTLDRRRHKSSPSIGLKGSSTLRRPGNSGAKQQQQQQQQLHQANKVANCANNSIIASDYLTLTRDYTKQSLAQQRPQPFVDHNHNNVHYSTQTLNSNAMVGTQQQQQQLVTGKQPNGSPLRGAQQVVTSGAQQHLLTSLNGVGPHMRQQPQLNGATTDHYLYTIR